MVPYIALFTWPLVSVVLFNRYSKAVAVLVTILAGYLLLPEKVSFDLPLLPPVNKSSIPAMAAFALAVLIAVRGRDGAIPSLPGWLPRSWLLVVLLLGLIGGEFITVLMNSDRLVYGPTVLPAMRTYDAFSAVMFAIMYVLPLLLARRYLCSPQAHKVILMAFTVAALVYSLFILFELRMSPQVHRMVYGYFPHVFGQHSKGGGWRPVVFLSHGLMLGMFLSFAVLSAIALFKTDKARRGIWLGASIWLFLMLAVSKNLGAQVITVLLASVLLFTPRRIQMLCAAGIAIVFLVYPAARSAGVIPIDRVVAMAESVSAERAYSLEYRLRNEDALLAKAQERPLFGWGGWGRNRVYNENGRDVSVTDGAWVISLGTSGWVGYVTTFGTFALPLILLYFRQRRIAIGPETVVLALIMAGNLIDLIPNASVTPLTWLVAGALWGRLEYGRAAASAGDTPELAPAVAGTARSRPVKARSGTPAQAPSARRTQRARQNAAPTYSRWPAKSQDR